LRNARNAAVVVRVKAKIKSIFPFSFSHCLAVFHEDSMNHKFESAAQPDGTATDFSDSKKGQKNGRNGK